MDLRQLPEDYRFQSHFLDVGGHRMHYLDEGSGPVVLLLHGNPTWSFYFRKLILALRDQFRVIAPDYIGCGLSDHPTDAHFRAVDRIDHVQALVSHLGLSRYSLVMHDWGGSIGTGLAVRNVAAVEKLVYLNTTLTAVESLPGIIKTAAAPVIGAVLTKYSMHFLKLTTTLGVCKPLPRDVKGGYYLPYKTAARRTAIWDFVADIPFDSSHPSYADMVELASKIPLLRDVPVQIIWGLKDPCFHPGMLTKVAGHFPQARVLEIPDASHLVLEDAPELSASTIKGFLLESREQAMAQSQGGVTQLAASGPRSMYPRFLEHVAADPQRDACIEASFEGEKGRYRHVTSRELRARINQYQRGLSELGLAAGDRVLMLVAPGSEFLALSYAVMARGAVPVFVDPGMGRDNLLKCIADCAPQAVIGMPKVQVLRWLKPKLFRGIKFFLTASDWMPFGDAHLGLLKRYSTSEMHAVTVEPDAPALIAFTSGATGTPKGVVFTHRMIAAQLELFGAEFGLHAGGKDLPLLPIFSLFTLPLGITSVFAPLDPARPLALDPKSIVTIIHELGVSSSFGSPTLWNKISEYCVRNGELLPSVKKVFMAGAPVPAPVLERVKGILPNGEAYTPYGATEALPVTLISATELLQRAPVQALSGEQGTLVGRAVKGLELRVVPVIDGALETLPDALPPRTIGEVLVRGSTVSPAYLNRPDANKAGKLKLADGTVWHRMGDVGYLDDDGYLYFCGRKVHCVRAPDGVLYPIPVERIFNQHPQVRRSALVRLRSDGTPAVVIEPFPQFWPESGESQEKLRRELQTLASSQPLTKRIEHFFFHPSFPVDARHNAKIFRDQLSIWAGEMDARERAAS